MPESPRIDPDVVLWTAPATDSAATDSAERPLVVLLHGYGADERDLFALAAHLPAEYDYAAVRAPPTPPWPAPGCAGDAIEGRDGRDPDAVTAAAAGVCAWVEEAAPGRRVGLVGFSQGAAVALQALRLGPERFAFAVNLSGYVADGVLPGDAVLAERKPPVFWGRGSHDEVIPEPLVAHTVDWLPAHAELSGRVYPGLTHSVSENELADVRAFLLKRLDEER